MLPAALDVQKIHYGTPRTLDNGGKSIYLSFNKAPIILQTPEMVAPFGMTKWDNDKGITKYTLDLSFKGMDARENLQTFFNKMNELDDKLIDDGVANSFEWLKKKNVSREVVRELYTKLVKFPIDKATGEISTKYPPTFKLTIPFKDGSFQCDVYDAQKKLVNLSQIETKGARVTAIIQCLGIWVAAGKFGCTWKVLQMRVSPPASIKGYAFKEVENDKADKDVDESDSDDEDPVDTAELLHHAPVDIAAKKDESEDEDDVVESSDEEDELEAKAPPPVKKTAAKKK